MADESSDAMNLGLSLSPISNPEPLSGSIPSETVNLPEFMEEEPPRRTRSVHRLRTRQQQWRRRRLMANPGNAGSSLADEGSVYAEERIVEVPKSYENNNSFIKEDDDTGKSVDNFYCCSICFDLAKDPVVTFCGHLFCWPCLFRWLYEFSDAEECPVCKGEATIDNLTPIYGCGSSTHEAKGGSGLNIPARPQSSQRSFAASTQHMLEEIENLKASVKAMVESDRANMKAMEERNRAMELKWDRKRKKDKERRKKDRAYQRMMYQYIVDPTNPIPKFPESSDSDDSD